jgi:hypothetical protein
MFLWAWRLIAVLPNPQKTHDENFFTDQIKSQNDKYFLTVIMVMSKFN